MVVVGVGIVPVVVAGVVVVVVVVVAVGIAVAVEMAVCQLLFVQLEETEGSQVSAGCLTPPPLLCGGTPSVEYIVEPGEC